MNIKTKLSIRFTIMVMTIITLFSIFIYIFTLNHRKAVYQTRLNDRAKSIASIYEQKIVSFDIKKDLSNTSANILSNESIYIIDLKNNKEYSTGIKFSDSTNRDIYLKEFSSITDHDFESEILHVNTSKHNYLVQVVAYDKYGFIRLNFLKLILTISWFVSLVLTSVISWFFVKNVLNPISSVIHQVNNISAHNLYARVDEGNGKDEIAQLAIKFNDMLVRLEESFNIQKTFVSNASHELKTPLTSITGQIEVTLLNDRTVEEYKELLKSLLEDIVNLNSLTQNLLDFAQININNLSIPFENIRIDELILNVREEAIKRLNDFKVTVYFENFSDDENLLNINGNEHLLKIAFINLLDNAYKYSFQKTASIYFRIVNSKVKITIKDYGIGIAEEDLKKISEPFYRSTSVMNIKGHGIGLSLTKKIIELHNGMLDSSSKLNQGSSFTVTLDLV